MNTRYTDSEKKRSRETLKELQASEELTITYRWARPLSYMMLAITLYWWYSLLFETNWKIDYTLPLEELMPLLWNPLAQLAVGVGLLYASACWVFNKTTLTLDSQNITISYEPLPSFLPPPFVLSHHNIRQVYVIQGVKQKGNKMIRVTYQVLALTDANESILLLDDLEAPLDAKYIEWKIEQFLGITPQLVAGEYIHSLKERNTGKDYYLTSEALQQYKSAKLALKDTIQLKAYV